MAKPVAVITGASSGIGLEFAWRLAREYDLVLVARRLDRLEHLAAEIISATGASVRVMQADLSTEEDVEEVATSLRREAHLGLLVNNAGFGVVGRFWEASLAEQERMHALHVMTTLRLTHTALRNMVARNTGAVINVASVAAFVSRAGSVSYGATKAWMVAFSEGVALDLRAAGSKVTIQALCPGFTYSEFHEVLGVDRAKTAGGRMWMTAGDVVDASLQGLRRGELIVVPGWRYKAVVAILPRLPRALRRAVLSIGMKKK